MRVSILFVVFAGLLSGCEKTQEAPAGAVVVHAEGTVEVDRGAGFVAVTPKLELAQSDVVRTGPSSFILLHLSNGHLVKLDADLSIRVQDIAQLNESTTELALAAQLDFLMNAEERARLPSAEVMAERVAGFQHRRRAARTVGAQSEPAKVARPAAESPPGGEEDAEVAAAEPAADEDEDARGFAKNEPEAKARSERSKGASKKEDVELKEARKMKTFAEPPPAPPVATLADDLAPQEKASAKDNVADLGSSGLGEGGGGSTGGLGIVGTGRLGAGRQLPSKKVSVSAAKAEVNGSLPKEAVQRVIRKNGAQIKYCYESALKKKPDTEGRMVVKFVIATGGKVSKVEVIENTTGNAPLASCVSSKVKRWRFPSPQSGLVVVSYPFVFSKP